MVHIKQAVLLTEQTKSRDVEKHFIAVIIVFFQTEQHFSLMVVHRCKVLLWKNTSCDAKTIEKDWIELSNPSRDQFSWVFVKEIYQDIISLRIS